MAVEPAAVEEALFQIRFRELSREALERMAAAGQEVMEIRRRLARTGDNIVGELIKGEDTFYEWNHYPDGDVYDAETGSQFFYHAHPADVRFGEHGHFHTFLRPAGMAPDMNPAAVPDLALPEGPNDALSHLIGISMDRYGEPICLFTTNRWVTGEVWYDGADVVRMLNRFAVGHTQPSWPVNRWITAMLRLFRPQIAALVAARDDAVAAWKVRRASRMGRHSVYEDRALEITSYRRIAVEDQIRAVEGALAASRGGGVSGAGPAAISGS